MKKTPYVSLLLSAALAAALCGCGSDSIYKRQIFAFAIPADPPAASSRTNLVALGRVTISAMFQSTSFTYRIGDDSYEEDPYACFVVSPNRALAAPIRSRLRRDGLFGRVIEPGSGLTPSVTAEASVLELDGDFRDPSHPFAQMTIHFIVYEVDQDGSPHVMVDKVCAGRTAMAKRTPEALMTAWDQDLREIMDDLSSEYAKAHTNDSR